MNLEITKFTNANFGEIRTIYVNNEIWFVAKDVANALKYKNTKDAIKTHIDKTDKQLMPFDTNGGKQKLSVINESGFYSLVFGCHMKKAKEFKHWVTSEVIPSIRKTGSYSIQQIKEPTAIDALEEFQATEDLANKLSNYFNVEKSMAKMIAFNNNKPLYKALNQQTITLLEANLPACESTVLPIYTPTQLAEIINNRNCIKQTLSARKVNSILKELGFQTKEISEWQLTDLGKEYANAIPYQNENSNHAGFQIKWKETIVPHIIKWFKDLD